MARRRASMREGPLAELFRATEAAQRQADGEPGAEPPASDVSAAPAAEPDERTVDHVPSWEEAAPQAPKPAPPPPPVPARVPPPQIHAVPAPAPQPVPHYADPLPEQPARLHRAPARDAGAYLAVIKVV